MRFCVPLVLKPFVVIVQHESVLINAPFSVRCLLRHVLAIKFTYASILPADRPCRGVDGVKPDRLVTLRVSKTQTVDDSAAFVRLVDEVRQELIFLRLDVFYREPADSNIRIIARVALESLKSSRLVPDRDRLDSGFPLKPTSDFEHSVEADDFVDVQLEVLSHSMLVDESRVPADIIVPVNALPTSEKRKSTGVQKKTLCVEQKRNLPCGD